MLAPLIVLALAAGPPAADRAEIFRAAGFHLKAGRWISARCAGLESASYSPGAIEQIGDLNRDGRPEMLVTESGTDWYGFTGTGFTLLTKSPQGRWSRIADSTGVATFLRTRANGWPELEVGGPGFCFPIHRFNGRAYVYHRQQYDGKPCRR